MTNLFEITLLILIISSGILLGSYITLLIYAWVNRF
jgi:hypothetical protein